MITYLALFLLGVFVLYKLSSSFSGALIGVFSSTSTNQHTDIQELFFRTVFTLLGYVAKRDGAINQREVKRTETYMEKMELDAAHKREAIRLFKMGAEPEFTIDKTIKQFQWLAEKSPNLVQILLVYLINLARVDGLLVNQEIEAVQKVALGLGYTNITFQHLLKMVSAQNKFGDAIQDQKPQNKPIKNRTPESKSTPFTENQSAKKSKKTCEEQTKDFETRSDQLPAAYAVFDLPPTASDAEVKKSYRNLVNQYHPDKLIGLGLPPYMIQSATECFQKIQAAYNYIKEARK
ncbi:co-chaperone protein DjlA [Cellvibrio zantedeschiae]|uniref:Co-chaperone protein DjlA n=1 Tax=Cellvibrio zantedeschiae TaxID=1237077 RepID=A0ABQ3AW61_9GAMM|nr:co-chaperone DjlA [Cellvibrio zantedeschiae]GGY68753.1 co-chaperone protein DjlA [Cellvibrio zantedeschiae]